METARKPRLTPLRGKENKKQLDERMKAAEERRKVKMNYGNEICRTSIARTSETQTAVTLEVDTIFIFQSSSLACD